jgi:L-lactate dehydrogenase complex protein LldG
MTEDRRRALARVRRALAALETRAPAPSYPDELTYVRGALDGHDRARAFSDQLSRVGGRVFTDPRALGEWLVETGRLRGFCEPSLVDDLGAAFPREIRLATRFLRDRIDDYDFGITRAAGAIAETGTLILNDAGASPRLAALAPWIHVAVVARAEIHSRLLDALRALGRDPNVVWCTGPSKTADVEGILIEGVHGPGEEVALIV